MENPAPLQHFQPVGHRHPQKAPRAPEVAGKNLPEVIKQRGFRQTEDRVAQLHQGHRQPARHADERAFPRIPRAGRAHPGERLLRAHPRRCVGGALLRGAGLPLLGGVQYHVCHSEQDEHRRSPRFVLQ